MGQVTPLEVPLRALVAVLYFSWMSVGWFSVSLLGLLGWGRYVIKMKTLSLWDPEPA